MTARNTHKSNSNKLPIIITICVAVLLAGGIGAWVYIQKQNLAQRDKTIQLQEAKASDTFDKKAECSKLTADIKQQIETDNQTSISGDLNHLSGYTDSFEMIFYSPKESGCLYVVHRLDIVDGKGQREYFIYNALTKSKVTSFKFPDQFEDYKKFVLDYSGGEVRL